MKTKMQETQQREIPKVEHIFLATINKKEILFIKTETQKPLALELPKDFLKKLISDVKQKS